MGSKIISPCDTLIQYSISNLTTMSKENSTTITSTEEDWDLTSLKARLAKAEEEVEVSNYNNKRLTKRLEEVMSQLKNTVTPL